MTNLNSIFPVNPAFENGIGIDVFNGKSYFDLISFLMIVLSIVLVYFRLAQGANIVSMSKIYVELINLNVLVVNIAVTIMTVAGILELKKNVPFGSILDELGLPGDTSSNPDAQYSSWVVFLIILMFQMELVLPKDKGSQSATFGPRPGIVTAPPENKTKIRKWVKVNKVPVDFWEEDAMLTSTWEAVKNLDSNDVTAMEGTS
ncbi:hypothetical protein HK098_005650 [Nowakowskiella sp. JEL0407]|nr:hypothetical protein HK098_005650 [Nowakowskiella sp. JEL0407]